MENIDTKLDIKIGDRLQTDGHGMATVVGFERFDYKGHATSHGVVLENTERVVCNLDDPKNWPCSAIGSGLYCVFTHEILSGKVKMINSSGV